MIKRENRREQAFACHEHLKSFTARIQFGYIYFLPQFRSGIILFGGSGVTLLFRVCGIDTLPNFFILMLLQEVEILFKRESALGCGN